MANLATETEFQERYPEHEQARDGVIDTRLTEGRVEVVALAGSRLTAIEADADGLTALKIAEMMLAYEAMSTRPRMSGAGGQTQEVGKTEGDRARSLVAAWVKKSLGSASLHKETIVLAPTFTPDEPETWNIEPSTSTSTGT